MRFILLLLLLALCITPTVFSQRMSREEYILKYKDIAIEKMMEYKIPASITLAQGILESGNGNSQLARRANNHFGIKCHKGWDGKKFKLDDDERKECFRKYKNPEESYRDHSLFLTERDRYSKLFTFKVTDYKSWARELKRAGYATNPKYPELLIKIIEENKLYEYDQLAMGKQPEETPGESLKAYIITDSSFEISGTGGNNRTIYLNNGKKFIIALQDDSFSKLAEEFNIYSWQVYKYNDLTKKDKLVPGQMIYLEKKKGKAREKYHLVEQGETMYTISQRFGIRLNSLYKKNQLKTGTVPEVGTRIKLR